MTGASRPWQNSVRPMSEEEAAMEAWRMMQAAEHRARWHAMVSAALHGAWTARLGVTASPQEHCDFLATRVLDTVLGALYEADQHRLTEVQATALRSAAEDIGKIPQHSTHREWLLDRADRIEAGE